MKTTKKDLIQEIKALIDIIENGQDLSPQDIEAIVNWSKDIVKKAEDETK